jgi:hypothetical protein
LISSNSKHAVVYAENVAEIKLSDFESLLDEPIVAVDTKKKYNEIEVTVENGILEAPYKSDWAIAIGNLGKLRNFI